MASYGIDGNMPDQGPSIPSGVVWISNWFSAIDAALRPRYNKSALSRLRPTHKNGIPRCRNTNCTASDAPPVPKTRALIFDSSRTASSMAAKPVVSVLKPSMCKPGRRVIRIQFTAPVCFALSCKASRCGITACLCGMVTFRPTISGCVSSQARNPSTCSIGKSPYDQELLSCAKKRANKAGERECPSGKPIRPSRRISAGKARTQELYQDRHQGNTDDAKYHQFEILLHPGMRTQQVSGRGE